jgi:hypothetical protein
MKNTKSNLIWLKILSFILSITPILLIIAFNWNEYTVTVVETLKLSVGMIIAVIFLLLKCIGRLRLPEKRVFTYFVVFAMVFLLESILNDLLLFAGGALIGELSAMPIEWKIKSMSNALHIDKTAEATAKALDSKIEAVVQKHITNGRV